VITYRNRVRQRIGSLEVLADHGRSKRGKVLWLCTDHDTRKTVVLRTDEVIRLDHKASKDSDGEAQEGGK
jgi:hypothetical protein